MELGCGLRMGRCTQSRGILSVISHRQMSVNGNKKLAAELVVFTDGWTYYQLNFYYMSGESKNLNESRV